MVRVLVIGGGYSGCAAAIAASQAGAQVALIERTDRLCGLAQMAGNMNLDVMFAFVEEAKAMGGGALFEATESIAIHKDVSWLRHRADYFYDVRLQEGVVKRELDKAGVDIIFETRAIDVEKDNGTVRSVKLEDGRKLEADALVDCGGTAGGRENCIRYGHGCVDCYVKCNSYGDRVSIAARAGAREVTQITRGGIPGAMSAAQVLEEGSLDPNLVAEVKEKGVKVIPLPKELVDYGKIGISTALPVSAPDCENLVLVDVGVPKLLGIVYMPLRDLRKVAGFERAYYTDVALGGSKGNAMRFFDITVRDGALRAGGLKNLFVAGEKAGPLSTLVACVVTGLLAGNNAARVGAGKNPTVLPRDLLAGDYIGFLNEQVERLEEQVREAKPLEGGGYRARMKDRGWDTRDVDRIRAWVEKAGFTNYYKKKAVG